MAGVSADLDQMQDCARELERMGSAQTCAVLAVCCRRFEPKHLKRARVSCGKP